MASPFTLGISAAAGFGAALALVLGVSVLPFAGVFLVSVNAFFFAMLASLIIYFLSSLRGVTVETVILLGIALVFLFSSLLALLQYIASEQALQQVVFWTLGSLVKASWPKIGIAIGVLVVVTPLFVRQVWTLTALRLGDEKALSLGINVKALRLQVLISISVLAAVAVAFVGTIGFVGLVGPHVARMLVGEDQRFFLPMSAICGAILLSAASIVSKGNYTGGAFPHWNSHIAGGGAIFPELDPGQAETTMVMRLEVNDLSFSYGATAVLDGVSMNDAKPGRITAIIGPNAAGKTTFFKCLAGLLKHQGSVRLDGIELKELKKEEVTSRVGYLPQEGPVNAVLTVFETLLLARKHTMSWRVREEDLAVAAAVLRDLDIEHLSLRYLNELSGGQKQMVSIAQVLARSPQVFLLDEPTSNLDLQRQLEVLSLLRQVTEERKTITLISLHDLNLAARFAHHIIVMNQGRIYASGDATSVLTPGMLRVVYRVNATVQMGPDGVTQIIPVSSAGSRLAPSTVARGAAVG